MPTGVYERPLRTCSIDGCSRRHQSRGYCNPHYLRFRRGEPLDIEPRIFFDLEARFWAKVEGGDFTTCWLWTASLNDHGYGQITVDKKPKRAHRLAYEFLRGDIPVGLVLDHLCSVRACVNPWHLEPVTQAVNIQRAMAARPKVG